MDCGTDKMAILSVLDELISDMIEREMSGLNEPEEKPDDATVNTMAPVMKPVKKTVVITKGKIDDDEPNMDWVKDLFKGK